jgi:hypothetical protein
LGEVLKRGQDKEQGSWQVVLRWRLGKLRVGDGEMTHDFTQQLAVFQQNLTFR